MDPTEQKNHRTAVATLEKATEEAFAALTDRYNGRFLTLDKDLNAIRQAISDERTHRLKLADEQRAYVDHEDRLLRERIQAFVNRGFWSRLNWLLTGR